MNLIDASKNHASNMPRPGAGLDLEGMMLELAKWGEPLLTQLSGGKWHCRVNVRITPLGAHFEVASDFESTMPSAAVAMCLSRLNDAVACVQKGSA